MKKYLIVTNIWGKKRDLFGRLNDYFDEERVYFDTEEEVNDYINLFEGVCANLKLPEEKWLKNGKETEIRTGLMFPDSKTRLWGYVITDTEKQQVIKWGGYFLRDIHQSYKATKYMKSNFIGKFNERVNKLVIKDYLFRGEDEIPKDYKWDRGEYEGWLQYRWGNGKNAIGYVEPKNGKKKNTPSMDVFDNPDEFAEELEDKYVKEDVKERLKIIGDRW